MHEEALVSQKVLPDFGNREPESWRWCQLKEQTTTLLEGIWILRSRLLFPTPIQKKTRSRQCKWGKKINQTERSKSKSWRCIFRLSEMLFSSCHESAISVSLLLPLMFTHVLQESFVSCNIPCFVTSSLPRFHASVHSPLRLALPQNFKVSALFFQGSTFSAWLGSQKVVEAPVRMRKKREGEESM